ncbi:MAG: toxin-antitoxin system YwqK family antitoxin [Cytophagales bacterium]|nr:MAG: toxin-antitoxin system YwqK family antitoxin [Cytophagales bacterium]
MFSTVFLMLVLIFQPSKLDTGYFYFGNTNLIGVGQLKDGYKSGEWKIYPKTYPDDFPKNSILEADPADFKRNFNHETPLFIMNFEAGIPNGDFLENYPNGKPKVMVHQKDGVFEGEFGEFYESRELRLKGKVLDGKKEGEWLEYSKSGKIISYMTYSNGYAEGKGLGYYPNGNLEWEGYFKNGELDGVYTYYLSDSTLKVKGQYSGGIPVGEWMEKLEILPGFYRKGNYQDGFKEGEWGLINLEGENVQTEYYEKGKLISISEFKVPDLVVDKGKVKNGKGRRIFYDGDGNILAKGKVSRGKEVGVWYFYFPESNRISAAGKLEGNDRIGTWNFYSYQGEIIDQKRYQTPDGHWEAMRKRSRRSSGKQKWNPNSSQDQGNRNFGSMGQNIETYGAFLK